MDFLSMTYDPEQITEEEELIIGAEVCAFQLHHLLWVVRFMLERPCDEWAAVFARAYELSCISVTRQKRLATLRWEKRMNEKEEQAQAAQDAESGDLFADPQPMGGGGECGAFPLPTPFPVVPSLAELRRFERALAEIDPAYLARLLDLPQG